jgi:hypothetical protein
MATPSPVFPAAVATDVQLKVANNLIQTTLRVNIDAGNTILFVASAAGFTANCLVSIDKEIVAIDSVIGAPNAALIVATGGRGFDGTSAVTHAAGAKVSMFIDAWHHNVLSAEVKAIEAFIGPNGQNIGSLFSYIVISKQYDFAAQSPGGTLMAGNNSITLSPVPKGVNGTDANHYLYISGGTGTAEAVLITGGGAVSGAASGTVIVNCANAHSGAWTIASASAGIVEAMQAHSGRAPLIYIPTGTHAVHAPITLTGTGLTLRGGGRLNTVLSTEMSTAPLLSASGGIDQLTVSDLTLQGPNAGNTFGISLVNASNAIFERIGVYGFANGISNTGPNAFMGTFRNIGLNNITGDGVYINTTVDGGTWEDVVIGGPATAPATSCGFHLAAVQGMRIKYAYVQTLGYGIWFNPGAGQVVSEIQIWDLYLDGFGNNSTVGVYFSPAGGTVQMIQSDFSASNGFQSGMRFDGQGAIMDVEINGMQILANTVIGIDMPVNTVSLLRMLFNNCWVENNTTSNPGASPAWNMNYCTDVTVLGGVYAQGHFGGQANTQSYGISIDHTTNVLVMGSICGPNVIGGIALGANNTRLVLRDVTGYNPVGSSTITVGASPFQYTAGPCNETVFITGGTISQVVLGGIVIATAAAPAGTSLVIPLFPNNALQITYTAAPTMSRNVS